MTADRTAARDRYDAFVGIAETAERPPYAFALAKLTYRIERSGRLALTTPEPLFNDFRSEGTARPGSDFWDEKVATDVVVQGSAFRSAVSRTERTVSVSVGPLTKKVHVFGRRWIEFGGDGRPHITAPEPFEQIPLTYENAYGGVDWRTPWPEGMPDLEAAWLSECDHPGLYPRNPSGKGYLVLPDPVQGMEMPNLEDPHDVLTPDRLIVGDPKLWYRQPLPWCFDWMHPCAFPRIVWFAPEVDALHPGPDDEEMPEVRRAYVPARYRELMRDRALEQGPDPRFYQEASLGLVHPGVRGGEKMRVAGMHPELDAIELTLPDPISIAIQIDGDRERVPTRVHHVVCRPADETLTVTYAASRELTRVFVPGVHKTIPVAACVDGDAPVAYRTPPTIRDQRAVTG